MSEDAYGVRVRPLDESGRPVEARPARYASPRSGLVVGGTIALIVVLAVGALIAWRALIGSPYGAAESVPADADIVVTVDFLQIRDVDRVDRLIRSFAEPAARHGLIDEVPDLEAALREFDDAAEAEMGFRFGEDALTWIGRSASVGVWVPEAAFDFDSLAAESAPGFLLSVDVRDQERAEAFLQRLLAEGERSGFTVDPIQVGGGPGWFVETDEEPFVVALGEGRLLLGDSTSTVRRSLELAPEQSVAQDADFQRLATSIGGEPVLTFFTSSRLGEKLSEMYERLGADLPFATPFGSAGMVTFTLDDDGIAVRAASPAAEGLSGAPARWSAALPADTYGFVDVVLPDGYVGDLTDLYLDTLRDVGLTDADVASFTAPADDVLGMSLVDDLLPQFGGELLFAVVPAADGLLARETGVDLGLLFAIGVEDVGVVDRALDSTLAIVAEQGVVVRERSGTHLIELEGASVGAIALTNDALVMSSSPDSLQALVDGTGTLGATDAYRRVDDLVGGDGLAFYVDIAGAVRDFAPDAETRDVLAPLVAAGAGYTVQDDLQVTEFRLVIDY